MRKLLMLLLLMSVILGLSAGASATLIPISNPSFEAQAFADGTWSPVLDNYVITGWKGSDANQDIWYGVLNPSAAMMGSSQATDGVNVTFSNGRTFGQWLNVDPILNARYILSVDIAYRLDHITRGSGQQSYTLNLVQDIGNDQYNVLATQTGWTPSAGTWATAVLVYDANSVGAGQLGIQLLSGGVQVLFDNVRLDMSPVPEPATMLLLGSGLMGLAAFGRKRLFKKV